MATIKLNNVSIATETAGAAALTVPSIQQTDAQNISGTKASHEMFMGKTFTLTGDLTVNDNLVFANLTGGGADITITDDGNGRTITTGSAGTLEAGEFLGTVPVPTNISTMTSGAIASGVTFPAGHVLQTKSYHTSSILTVVCASNTHTDLPTFVIAITPSSTSSKILVMLNIGGFNFSSTNYGISGAGQLRRKIASGSFAGIGIGTANAIWNATFVLPQQNSYQYNSVHAIYLDSPNTTSVCTYGIAVNDHNNGTQTFYLNRMDPQNYPYAQSYASSIIVQEIAG
jgi:hypothetical protein